MKRGTLLLFLLLTYSFVYSQDCQDCSIHYCDGYACTDASGLGDISLGESCGCADELNGGCATMILDISNHPSYGPEKQGFLKVTTPDTNEYLMYLLEEQVPNIHYCKVADDQIGIVGKTLQLGDNLIVFTNWIAKDDDPDEFIGFEFISTYPVNYTVKAGSKEYPGDANYWIHPNGTSGPQVKAISNISFCADGEEDENNEDNIGDLSCSVEDCSSPDYAVKDGSIVRIPSEQSILRLMICKKDSDPSEEDITFTYFTLEDYEVSCDDNIDNDFDGLVDGEDDDCETTSSEDGGLESNHRLSEDIAYRMYKRNITNYQGKKEIYTDRNRRKVNQRSEYYELEQFISPKIISQSSAFITSPTELIDMTNAIDVFGVDVYQDNRRIGAVLSTRTHDAVYEHTKYICDRLFGGEILNIFNHSIEDQPFILSEIRIPGEGREYACSFSLRTESKNNFTLENHWNLEKYPQDDIYYNFQVWAASIVDLEKMVRDIISNANALRSIDEYHISEPPALFVKRGYFKDGKISLDIVHKNEVSEMEVSGNYSMSETSDYQNFQTTVSLNSTGLAEIPVGNIFNTGIRIDAMDNTTPDDLYFSDGPWGLDHSDPSSQITTYEVIPSENMVDESSYPMKRNVRLEAQVDNHIAIYRALNPRFKPVNVSAFNALSFEAKGKGIMDITIIKSSIDKWEDQFHTSVLLSEKEDSYNINTNQFSSTIAEYLQLDDVVMIVFDLRPEDESNLVNLQLSNLNLTNIDNKLFNQFSKGSTLVTPNPFHINTEVYYHADIPGETTLSILNMNGKLLKRINQTSISGPNKFSLDMSDFQTGIYYYTVQNEQTNLGRGKLILTR